MRNISKTTTEHTVVKSALRSSNASDFTVDNRSIIILTWSTMMPVSVKRLYALVYRLSGAG